MVEVGDAKNAGDARLRRPAARIAGQREGARRSSVVRPVPCANLVTPAEHPRDANRIFVRLSAAVGEEEGVDVAGCDLRKLHAEARPLVAVPDVHAHQLAIEVDEALSFRRPEVDSLCPRDGNRFHRGLRGPLEERVPAAEIDDLLARHGFGNDSHGSAMLPKSRPFDNVRSQSQGVCTRFFPDGWFTHTSETRKSSRTLLRVDLRRQLARPGFSTIAPVA